MKKQSSFFNLLAIGLCSALSFAEAEAAPLKAGVTDVFAPMCFRDAQGKMVGYEVDLLQEIAKRTGDTIEFTLIDWDKKTDLLNNGAIDLLASGLNVTPERKKIYTLSESFIKNTQAIVVGAESSIRGRNDLAGKTVCMEAGTFSIAEVEGFKDANGRGVGKIEQIAGADGCLRALIDGSVDASVQDSLPAAYYAGKSPGMFRILNENFGENEIAFGFRKADTELAEHFNKALKEIEAEGVLSNIHKRWFGDGK